MARKAGLVLWLAVAATVSAQVVDSGKVAQVNRYDFERYEKRVKALLANTNNVYVGNDGANDVTSANGLELAAGDSIIFDHVGNLGSIWLDVDTNGEGVAWLMLDV